MSIRTSTVAVAVLAGLLAGCGTSGSERVPGARSAGASRAEAAIPSETPNSETPNSEPPSASAMAQNETDVTDPTPSYNDLTPEEARVILHKGTEWRGTGEYTDLDEKGTYVCRQCNIPLYTSDQKFHSGCGWPAFDDEIEGRVERHPDADGQRTEIVCSNCKGHLGHVFLGEGFTAKNTRHCVNSISMRFVPAGAKLPEPIVLEK